MPTQILAACPVAFAGIAPVFARFGRISQMAGKPPKVLARIGHSYAYESVRGLGYPSLSHLLSASAAFNGAFCAQAT
jgi:hypothetical protein